jgi:hypothetical protein
MEISDITLIVFSSVVIVSSAVVLMITNCRCNGCKAAQSPKVPTSPPLQAQENPVNVTEW